MKTISEESNTPHRHWSDKARGKTRPIYECRSYERLKTKAEESTLLAYTGLLGGLEHLRIEGEKKMNSLPSEALTICLFIMNR